MKLLVFMSLIFTAIDAMSAPPRFPKPDSEYQVWQNDQDLRDELNDRISSVPGDNLGNHTATMTITSPFGINTSTLSASTISVSTITFSNIANVYFSTPTLIISTNIYTPGFITSLSTITANRVVIASGTAAIPGLHFDLDPDTGLANTAVGNLMLVSDGVTRVTINSLNTDSTVSFMAPDGNSTRAGFGYRSENSTGFNRSGTGNIIIILSGTNEYQFQSSSFTFFNRGGVFNGTTKLWEVTSSSEVLQPLQPGFLAINSATDNDQTGAGSTIVVQFDSERYDTGSDFASSSFTAPVDGKYLLTTGVSLNDTGTGNLCEIRLVTSNATYVQQTNPTSGRWHYGLSVVADMETSDVASVQLNCSGGFAVVDVLGTNGSTVGSGEPTFFSGTLLN